MKHLLRIAIFITANSLFAESAESCELPKENLPVLDKGKTFELTKRLMKCNNLMVTDLRRLLEIYFKDDYLHSIHIREVLITNLDNRPNLISQYLDFLQTEKQPGQMAIIHTIYHRKSVYKTKSRELYEIALKQEARVQIALFENILWLNNELAGLVIPELQKQLNAPKEKDRLHAVHALTRIYGDHFAPYLAKLLEGALSKEAKYDIISNISTRKYGFDGVEALKPVLFEFLKSPEKARFDDICDFLVALKPDHTENEFPIFLSKDNFDFALHCMHRITSSVGLRPFENLKGNSTNHYYQRHELLQKFVKEFEKSLRRDSF